MTWQERILNDGTDRESWLEARSGAVIGASDAAKFAKLTSVNSYVEAKLKPSTFAGNGSTQSGNRWEPMLLAWAGVPGNKALIHHPDEPGFAATPDGIRVFELGSAGWLNLAEIKAKHNKIINGPTPAEFRQVAWQLFVIPEAEYVDWVWGELVEVNGEWELRDDSPKKVTFMRTDPRIIATQNEIVPIATAVLAEIRHREQLKEAETRRLALLKEEAGF